MFFFFAVMPFQEKLDYPISGICQNCGNVCSYDILMSGSTFTLFFIPIFRFGKKYFVRINCCDSFYLLNSDIGKKIERGTLVAFSEADLTYISGKLTKYKNCPHCGQEVENDFIHCPRCGVKL